MVIENITKFSEASTLAYNIKVKNLQILAALKDKEDGARDFARLLQRTLFVDVLWLE
jgi:hypothetical protein